MKLALVIPNYNHHYAIEQTLVTLARYELPCYLVDDGSNEQTRYILEKLAQRFSWVKLLHHPYNRGKGAAVTTGLRAAYRDGFSHALQVDADGQHNLDDIEQMIAAASASPDAVISGLPQYDESIPKGRYYGRFITHFWVWVETLSLQIKDSMCGFRVYPLAATEALFLQDSLGERMDFDIEILVKLFWRNVQVVHVPTKVIYPEGGISHFQGFKDNMRISWMHTRLFFGMLKRLPQLLRRNKQPQHWSSLKERGSYWGIKLLANSYRIGGHWLCRLIMYPVICYFFLTGHTAREASLKYLRYAQACHPNSPDLQGEIGWRHSLKHFISFGNAAIDRIDAWCDRIKLSEVDFPDREQLANQLASGQGAVLLVSHLGNLELCRAISINQRKVKVNVLVMTEHAENFNRVLKQLNPDSALNLIQVTELGPSTSMLLQQKVEQGELVVIAGDRTSSSSMGRVVYSQFMGHSAPFPQGPFILSGLLDCPVYMMFCLRHKQHYRVYVEPFTASLKGPRKERAARLDAAVAKYSERLEHHIGLAPMQWFNFFDFWQKDDQTQRDSQRNSPQTQNESQYNRTEN